jgi:hypothetical protein
MKSFTKISVLLVCIGVVSLAGCVKQKPRISLDDRARNICLKNGFKPGTMAYATCFTKTLEVSSQSQIEAQRNNQRMMKTGLEMATQQPRPVYMPPACYYNGYRQVCY